MNEDTDKTKKKEPLEREDRTGKPEGDTKQTDKAKDTDGGAEKIDTNEEGNGNILEPSDDSAKGDLACGGEDKSNANTSNHCKKKSDVLTFDCIKERTDTSADTKKQPQKIVDVTTASTHTEQNPPKAAVPQKKSSTALCIARSTKSPKPGCSVIQAIKDKYEDSGLDKVPSFVMFVSKGTAGKSGEQICLYWQ